MQTTPDAKPPALGSPRGARRVRGGRSRPRPQRWQLSIAALALVATFAATPVDAQVADRSVSWRTIRSEHFEVNYPRRLAPVARRVLYALERAHDRVTPILENEPEGRTQVTLYDDSESANGSATALPYNSMRLFATAPEDLSPLADYDDWLTTLITHEHTHVVHLSTISGIPAIINAIFGRRMAPNQVQPRWLIEGLATYLESRETSGGRMRSTQFEMYLRMAFLEGRELTLDQLSNNVDQWPRGTSWYLYGSRIVAYVAERHGMEAFAQMSRQYGRNPIPYAVQRVARRATGSTWSEIYEDFRQERRAHYQRVLAEIEAEGRVEGERLTHHGETALYPRFLSPTRLVYTASDGHSDPQLRELDLETGETRRRVRVAGRSRATVVPSRVPGEPPSLIFDSVDWHRDVYARYDLFEHRAGARERGARRLTDGLRARAPDVSPDGEKIVFVTNEGGTSQLEIADRDDIEGTHRRLVRSRRFEQAYTPRFSPDGRRIAFSMWREGGYRDVRLLDLETGRIREITRDRALDTGPIFTPDGRGLVFSSDRTGIANLYVHILEGSGAGRTRQITNVVAGAYAPEMSPSGDRVVYVGYTSFGFDLFSLALTGPPESWGRPARDYIDTRPPAADVGYGGAASHRYRPIRTLYPRAYTLTAGTFGQPGFGIRVGVRGEDAVGFFSFRGLLTTYLESGDVDVDASFSLRRAATPLTLRAFRYTRQRDDLIVRERRTRWDERGVGADLSVAHRFPRSFHSTTLAGGVNVLRTRSVDPLPVEFDPNFRRPFIPERAWYARARLSLAYSDVRQRIYDMTPSAGRTFGVSMSASHPRLLNPFRAASLSWSIRTFRENPWVPHHVFALRYAGGLSAGDRGRRSLFRVGGFPSPDIAQLVLDQPVFGGTALRGYSPAGRTGLRFQMVQLEYRFPLFRIQRGLETLPIYLNRVHALVFTDYGDAYSERIDLRTFRLGVGAEIYLDFTVGHTLPFTLRAGFAYGVHEGGGPRGYLHLGRPF